MTDQTPDPIRLCLLGFNHVKGIGAVRLQALIKAFGDPASAWHASSEQLHKAGLNHKIVENLLITRQRLNLHLTWEQLVSQGIQIITWNDEEYPHLLREINQPPPLLYVRGTLNAEDDWAIAIVGTRRMTAYGRRTAEQIGAALAQNRITVVSGLARGVDAAAHQSVLAEGGRTLAILGCGIDQIYPPEHRQLAEKIIKNGAIISDYPPGTGPEAVNFPARNRIISGLTVAVVVIEAGDTSGALITARFAAEQGRDVFSVPGSIFSPASKGTNRLIADGATPVLNVNTILEQLQVTQLTEYKTARVILPGNPAEENILAILDNDPQHIDEIHAKSNLPIDELSATLTLMELKGMIHQVGRMNFVVRDSL